ncbi:regulator of G-protein signaling [Pimephales promelas]|nr:regulator of G-protein signaling [Pimephales promelas]
MHEVFGHSSCVGSGAMSRVRGHSSFFGSEVTLHAWCQRSLVMSQTSIRRENTRRLVMNEGLILALTYPKRYGKPNKPKVGRDSGALQSSCRADMSSARFNDPSRAADSERLVWDSGDIGHQMLFLFSADEHLSSISLINGSDVRLLSQATIAVHPTSMLASSPQKCDCLLSLKANSLEQKARVCQCLSENINTQLQLHGRQAFGPYQQMLEPKQDEPCDLRGQRMTSEEDQSDATARSLTLLEDMCTSLEENPVPPTPPPSTEGEDGRSTESSVHEDEAKEKEFSHAHAQDCDEEKQLLGDEENASDTNAPPSSSSSSFVIPELRLDRSFSADALSTPGTDEEYEDEDEEEDDDEEEEDSDENYLERSDSKRRSMVEASSCEKHPSGLSVQNSLRRRTHSEGSLLQDPRTTCFTSDNAIHCMEGSGTHAGGWTLPSPRTLKKELTKNGGSMHQLCMLFSGRKLSAGSECSCDSGPDGAKKKKSKNLAKDMKNRLAFLRRRNESPGSTPVGKLDKTLKSIKPTPEEAMKWGESLDKLLVHKCKTSFLYVDVMSLLYLLNSFGLA